MGGAITNNILYTPLGGGGLLGFDLLVWRFAFLRRKAERASDSEREPRTKQREGGEG